jgi:hypothetical protein
MFTASRPEAQKRLICTPEQRKSHPALSAATFGDHAALFAHGRHHAHHHVVHLRCIKLVALLQVGQQTRKQVDGLNLVQAAVFFALATRRSQGVKHIGFGHGGFSG